jgi:hypothetical protein
LAAHELENGVLKEIVRAYSSRWLGPGSWCGIEKKVPSERKSGL